MYIYESPRRSPRNVARPATDGPKTKSPIRKGKAAGRKGKTVAAGEALAVATGRMKRVPRAKKGVSEDQENIATVPRGTRQMGCSVVAPVSSKTDGVKRPMREGGRVPLRELQINDFVEKLKKREVAPSVEVTVLNPPLSRVLMVEYDCSNACREFSASGKRTGEEWQEFG
jgi:hypothetical protein